MLELEDIFHFLEGNFVNCAFVFNKNCPTKNILISSSSFKICCTAHSLWYMSWRMSQSHPRRVNQRWSWAGLKLVREKMKTEMKKEQQQQQQQQQQQLQQLIKQNSRLTSWTSSSATTTTFCVATVSQVGTVVVVVVIWEEERGLFIKKCMQLNNNRSRSGRLSLRLAFKYLAAIKSHLALDFLFFFLWIFSVLLDSIYIWVDPPKCLERVLEGTIKFWAVFGFLECRFCLCVGGENKHIL